MGEGKRGGMEGRWEGERDGRWDGQKEVGREDRRGMGEGGTQIVVGSGKGSVCKYKCLQQL